MPIIKKTPDDVVLKKLLFKEQVTNRGLKLQGFLSREGRASIFNGLCANSVEMQAIAASSTAMQAVILSQTALDAIYGNSSAKSVFKSSTALTVKEIPTMTSNTTPEGEASASSIYSSEYDVYKAFNENSTDMWISASDPPQWIQYTFASPVFIHTLYLRNYGGDASVKECKLQVSTNGSSFIDVFNTVFDQTDSVEQVRDVAKAGYYRYWRLYISSVYQIGNQVRVRELDLVGWLQPQQ